VMRFSLEKITSALRRAGLLEETRGDLPESFESICDDSRKVERGSLFIAVRGSARDGHDYLEKAAELGASAAMVEDPSRTKLPSIVVRGIDMHIGSQITELAPYREAASRMLALVDALAAEGIALDHVDLGGGLGIRYRDEVPVTLAAYATMVRGLFEGRRERLLFEPGRRLVGDAGVLLTRVRVVKAGASRNFAVVDAAMNDLLRPSLYDAWHAIDPVRPREGDAARHFDVVGPICESGDFLALDRKLAIAEDDLLAIRTAGAYAMAMSSNYNARPRACEVLVDGASVHLIRRRETVAELHAHEIRLPTQPR